MSTASRRKASGGSTSSDPEADAGTPRTPQDLSRARTPQDLSRARTPKPFKVLSFVAGLVFMVGGASFLGQQNGWFSIDLGTVLPIVAIVGGLAAIFGTRHNE
jgi:hypothetical protein